MPPSLTGGNSGRFSPGAHASLAGGSPTAVGEVFRLQAIALRADQFESLAREIPSIRDGQTIGLIAEALRRDLEQLPLIQEERCRGDRILYGHGKTKRKGVNNA
ncbi:MAG TPA: hypothetical protein VJT81_10365 [Burkholderiales bacterium]|nr:hypothetical protein [Burkholderiales bacterium]